MKTAWQPLVRKIKDGQVVEQSSVNTPLEQLAQRDEFLRDQLEKLAGKSALVSLGVDVHPSAGIQPGEQSVVFFKQDVNGTGLSRAITGFSSNQSSSVFAPNASNYIYGLLSHVTAGGKADVYTSGLCDLAYDLDDPLHRLLQLNPDGTVETFAVGPYYLSGKQPGKITKDPSGVPVYVGYAISKRRFLLQPNVDEFSQFFINYRFCIIDRVAGVPATSGVRTISSSNLARLGWVAVDSLGEIPVPTDARFFYNIPTAAQLAVDAGIDSTEKEVASELRKYLPPIPHGFIQLYIGGVLQRQRSECDPTGSYLVNEYGLWWFDNTSGNQPWANDYPAVGPELWSTVKLSAARKHTFTSFSKFNPTLKTQLVASLTAFDTAADQTSNILKLTSKDNPSEPSSFGDLLLSFDPTFERRGLSGAAPVVPTGTAADYTANQAIVNLTYSKTLGKFVATVAPLVSKIEGLGGITVTEVNPGEFSISYLSQGLTGTLDSIEPVNSRLEFKGLTSYFKLPPPSSTPYGIIGKIALPKGSVNNKALRLVFQVFGDASLTTLDTNRKLAFQFQYASVSALNSANPSAFNTIAATTYAPAPNPDTHVPNPELDLVAAGTAYTLNQSVKVFSSDIVIPANHVREDSVISFKITRVAPVALGYVGNIGLLSTYWEAIN